MRKRQEAAREEKSNRDALDQLSSSLPLEIDRIEKPQGSPPLNMPKEMGIKPQPKGFTMDKKQLQTSEQLNVAPKSY